MAVKVLARSFAGGELGPELYGRFDLVKHQTGLALARNFQILPHGPAQNRAGFGYVLEVKDSTRRTRMMDFAFNTQQTFALEFGHLYVRFHTNGGTLLEVAKNITAITQANPGVVTINAHGYSNGQWLFLAGIGGMTQLNGRFVKVAAAAANTLQIQGLDGVGINTTGFGAYTAGGTAARVYEIPTPYTENEVFDLHYVQSADVLTLVHPSHAPAELRRLSATSWTLTNVAFNPNTTFPADLLASRVSVGGTPTEAQRYVATAVDANDYESPASPQSVDKTAGTSLAITGITQANPAVVSTAATFENRLSIGDRIFITGVVGMVQVNNLYFRVIAVTGGGAGGGTITLGDPTTGVGINSTGYAAYVSGGNLFGPPFNDLLVAGNYNRIDISGVAGATEYRIYKKSRGVFGIIATLPARALVGLAEQFIDTNYTSDLAQALPERLTPFAAAGDYPAAVTYHEQRRWFGGTNNKPQNLFATRSATESDLTQSTPSRDDDAIAVRIAARQVNAIRHLVPLDDLLICTSGGEWKVATQNSEAITPSSISLRPQGNAGANNVQPVTAVSSILYAQATGGRVREILYAWEKNGYRSNDISYLAPHLFDAYTLTSLAFAKAPYPTAWTTRSDGVLLGLTYSVEQQVAAWHQHNTDGLFESVATVTEGSEDVAYAVIRRTINGRSVRYVERQRTRRFTTLADCFHVDAGLTYSGAAATTVSGLHHLEGKTVSILADGAVHPRKVVTAGSVTLDQAASLVHVGLPYTSDFQTLPMAMEAQAMGQGLLKDTDKVYLRVHQSSGINVGPSFDDLVQYKQRTDEVYGAPPRVVSDEIQIEVFPLWGTSAPTCVRQSDPLPITLLALTAEVAIGG